MTQEKENGVLLRGLGNDGNRNGAHPKAPIPTNNIETLQIFGKLVKAMTNGDIGGQYANGELIIYPGNVVDKDRYSYEELQRMIKDYAKGLRKKHVPKDDVNRLVHAINNAFNEGPTEEQPKVFSNLEKAVKALNNGNPTGNPR